MINLFVFLYMVKTKCALFKAEIFLNIILINGTQPCIHKNETLNMPGFRRMDSDLSLCVY